MYIETSALAKRYLRETGSDEFDGFLGRMLSASISRLTIVEFRCLLGRRRRNRDIDADAEHRAADALDEDVTEGFLEVYPLEDRHAAAARDLLTRLYAIPLRTLDALHLAIAGAMGAATIATADRILAAAGSELGFQVEYFGRDKRRVERRAR